MEISTWNHLGCRDNEIWRCRGLIFGWVFRSIEMLRCADSETGGPDCRHMQASHWRGITPHACHVAHCPPRFASCWRRRPIPSVRRTALGVACFGQLRLHLTHAVSCMNLQRPSGHSDSAHVGVAPSSRNLGAKGSSGTVSRRECFLLHLTTQNLSELTAK